uniref:Macaca fascicularis brain cDNA clone: QbsA-10111, similar to human hippocalcin like 4 (HPCAL4), mRNA, RefSeq: NM_016257.2 n=1 Tax=Macaca fascicularis TaxID=9541 RepID=I7GKB2_MACFA|nr:unnamed protein product [Macaca fascicularis]
MPAFQFWIHELYSCMLRLPEKLILLLHQVFHLTFSCTCDQKLALTCSDS